MWGGTADQIAQTIRFGVNNGDDRARQSQMPNFGGDKLLEPAQIDDVAEYVLSLTKRADDPAAAARGKEVFAQQCAACHGDQG